MQISDVEFILATIKSLTNTKHYLLLLRSIEIAFMTAKLMLRIIRAKRLITVAIINIFSGSLKTSKTYLLLSTSGDEIPSLRSSRTFSGDNKEAICWLNVTRLSPPRPPSVAMINYVPRKQRKIIRSASRNLQNPALTKLFIKTKNACFFWFVFSNF